MVMSIKGSGLHFVGLFFLGVGIVGGSAMAHGQDLKASQDFIHGFFEQNGFYQTSGPNGQFQSERDRIAFKGCKVTVHAVTVQTLEPPKRESFTFDILFNLKDLDPEVTASPKDLNGNSLPDTREWVMLKTADGNESILMQLGGSTMSSVNVLPLQGGANHEETQKLADAFRRAITACH